MQNGGKKPQTEKMSCYDNTAGKIAVTFKSPTTQVDKMLRRRVG